MTGDLTPGHEVLGGLDSALTLGFLAQKRGFLQHHLCFAHHVSQVCSWVPPEHPASSEGSDTCSWLWTLMNQHSAHQVRGHCQRVLVCFPTAPSSSQPQSDVRPNGNWCQAVLAGVCQHRQPQRSELSCWLHIFPRANCSPLRYAPHSQAACGSHPELLPALSGVRPPTPRVRSFSWLHLELSLAPQVASSLAPTGPFSVVCPLAAAPPRTSALPPLQHHPAEAS
mmetsp:Transcript_4577/g.11065  ORF Transcript_4577/g.11065 Transcript_4577/m.11065 type:complete len:225 (-) Transcript_4577:1759-2433(-)